MKAKKRNFIAVNFNTGHNFYKSGCLPDIPVASFAAMLLVLLSACGGGNTDNDSGGSNVTGANVANNQAAETARSLTPFASADSFNRSLKDALINHFDRTGNGTNALASSPQGGVQPIAETDSLSVDASVESASDSGDGGANSSASSTSFTDTNLQEVGVDEADRIKTDGRYLYVLGNETSYDIGIPGIGLPAVIDLPIDVSVDVGDAATSDIAPYQPGGIRLRVLELDSDSADAGLLHESALNLGGSSLGGMYLVGDAKEGLVLTTTRHGGGYWAHWDTPYFWGSTQSAIHRLDVSDRTAPVLARTASFDGQIISSRVVGNYLYLASRYFPQAQGIDLFDPAVSIRETIEAADITEWMPQYTANADGESRPMADANNCFVSDLPDDYYYVPDIVTLAVINLDDLTLSDSVCYLGAVETLYASPNAAYLATTGYDYTVAGPLPQPLDSEQAVDPDRVDAGVSDTVSVTNDEDDGIEPEPVDEGESPQRPVDTDEFDTATDAVFHTTQSHTDIHQFNFADGSLQYVGSGRVDGYLGGTPQQQAFRFSEKDGYLRVATQNDAAFFGGFDGSDGSSDAPGRSPVFLSVLQPASEQTLEVVGRLPNADKPAHIGKPGENLHASRFIGDKAYLVTFRQTDPLYVIDMSNPTDPSISGELEIEGYSDYLHPIGENYLLGLGRGAIADPSGSGDTGRGAFATGIKISLFDVSNPAAPIEVESIEVGRRGSNAEALFDHHGITLRAASDGQPARLAIGIDVNDIPQNDSFSFVPWYGWRESGLHTFEIHTGVNAGIQVAGKMIVEAASPQNPWGPSVSGDRSVLVNDAVFYIHGDQVYSAIWGSVENYNGPR